MNLQNKRKELEARMDQLCQKDVCIAFSGGVDSSLLLCLAVRAAKKHGTKVYGITFDTVLHPRADEQKARAVAKELGAIYEVIRIDELQQEEVRYNDVRRCYFCKQALFTSLLEFAKKKNLNTVMEGTNYDDLSQYRPGIQAVRELGILSPLADAKLTKCDVRDWAKELGISVSNRPSTPCMATRLPYGTEVKLELLQCIEKGEEFLRSLGLHNVRLRVHGDIARIEVDKEMMLQAMAQMDVIVKHLKELGFLYITLDLEGFRSGSMDVKNKYLTQT